MSAKKKQEITIRSSAAEYLTFISTIGDQPDSVELRYQLTIIFSKYTEIMS